MSEAMHLEYRDSTAIAGIGKMEYTTGALTPSSEMILDSVRAAIADAGGFNGVQRLLLLTGLPNISDVSNIASLVRRK